MRCSTSRTSVRCLSSEVPERGIEHALALDGEAVHLVHGVAHVSVGRAEETGKELSRIGLDRDDVRLARPRIAHVAARSARVERDHPRFDRAQAAGSREPLREELVDADAAAPALVSELGSFDFHVRTRGEHVSHALGVTVARELFGRRRVKAGQDGGALAQDGHVERPEDAARGPAGPRPRRFPGAQHRADGGVPDEETLRRRPVGCARPRGAHRLEKREPEAEAAGSA
jgi:hypothetical protein